MMNNYLRLGKQYLLILTGAFLYYPSIAQDTTVTTISADGPGDTYSLLESALGGSPLEVPDCDHTEVFKHIEELYDDELERNVFKFYIHKDIDTDRCETNVDRQRNEIKAYDPSPDYLKAIQREVVTYEWFFKIDEFFQPSTNFTHLFQLKAVGGNDAANPLLTITPRKGDPEQLQLIHGRGNNSYTTVTYTDLSLIKGRWVQAYCKVEYADNTGTLDVSLKLLDGTEVLSYTSNEIDMWRTGSSFVRPKWGIYRSLNDINSLRDEEVLFADFKVTEIGACPAWYEDADGDGMGDPNSFVYACERPDGYVQNNVDTCVDWFEDADGDGLGNPEVSQYGCAQPAGYVDNADDPDDTKNALVLNATIAPKPEVYPNPATNAIKILHMEGAENYRVLDMGGRVVLTGSGSEISIESLMPGVYFLHVEGQVFRFIKK